MSILDTFYVLFKTDTSELKKGVEEADKEIQKVEQNLERLEHTSDKVGESFHGLLQSVTALFAGFASFHAVLSGAEGAIESIRQVGQASRELNIDVSTLDAWGHAVQRAGGTAEGFQRSLEGLADHFGTTNQIALQVLPRLADMFNRLSPRNAQVYGKSLGLDQATILLLQQGRREVEDTIKQQQKFGLVTKEQVETTRKFDNALYDAGRAYQQFYRELAVPLLPGITQGINYFITHKEVVQDAFKAMATGVTLLTLALIRLGGPITKAAAAITAIAAGYGILKEDIKFFREGKDSLIGTALGYKPGNVGNPQQLVKNIGAQYTGNALLSIPSQLFGAIGNAFSFQNPFKSSTVTIGEVVINTQATDANGIALAAADSLRKHISQTIDNLDNGVAK